MELWVTWGDRGWAWTPFLLLQELPSPSDKEETDVINGQEADWKSRGRGSLLWELPSGKGRVLSTGAKRAGRRAKKPGPRKAESVAGLGAGWKTEACKGHEEESAKLTHTRQGRQTRSTAGTGGKPARHPEQAAWWAAPRSWVPTPLQSQA